MPMFGIGRTNKRDVLRLIGERTREKLSTSFRTLKEQLWLSEDAACSHLKRLWRERLIKSTEDPPDFLQAARLGQSIRELRFRITRRGLERIDRWRKVEEGDPWPV